MKTRPPPNIGGKTCREKDQKSKMVNQRKINGLNEASIQTGGRCRKNTKKSGLQAKRSLRPQTLGRPINNTPNSEKGKESQNMEVDGGQWETHQNGDRFNEDQKKDREMGGGWVNGKEKPRGLGGGKKPGDQEMTSGGRKGEIG